MEDYIKQYMPPKMLFQKYKENLKKFKLKKNLSLKNVNQIVTPLDDEFLVFSPDLKNHPERIDFVLKKNNSFIGRNDKFIPEDKRESTFLKEIEYNRKKKLEKPKLYDTQLQIMKCKSIFQKSFKEYLHLEPLSDLQYKVLMRNMLAKEAKIEN